MADYIDLCLGLNREEGKSTWRSGIQEMSTASFCRAPTGINQLIGEEESYNYAIGYW